MLRLEPLLAQPVRQLSLGQRMRAEFAAALLHDPEILFLDEPTIGLDAPSKLAVRDFVRRLNREQGVTVLLTTHDMLDVEALAERVIVIGQGRLLADGPFASLRAGVLAERRLHIDFAESAPAIAIPGVTVRARGERSLELAFDPTKIPAPKLIAAIATQHAVEDIHVDEVAIEEVITRFYELHELTEGAHEA
jgi:ABC-2 type transport system ATP-binding protein